MKNFKLKITALLLCLMFLFIAGCQNTADNGGGGGTTTPTEPNNIYGGYDMYTGVDFSSPKIDIVKQGNSRFSVVIPENASSAVSFAAQEMSDFIRQLTGISLPIEQEDSVTKANYISLGTTNRFKALGITLDSRELNIDGFIIKTVGDNIFISGSNDRGTLYGVYDFLEKFGGIRFVAPEITHIPQTTELAVHQMDIKEVPVFAQRNYYNQYVKTNSEFELRTRMFSDVTLENERFGHVSEWYQGASGTIHNILDYVPKSEYYAAHPEFYVSHSHDRTHSDDVCYSNGITEQGEIDETMEISVAKAVLNSLKKFATEQENARYFMIGLNDDRNGYCECQKCAQSNQRYMNGAGTVIVFMNAMSRAMDEWVQTAYPGRDIQIVFFAYFWTEQAPAVIDSTGKYVPFSDKVVLAENVHVRIAPLDANYAYSFLDEKQTPSAKKLFASWQSLTKKLMVWDYNTYYAGYLWYVPSLNYLVDNLKYYETIGTSYILNQSSYNAGTNWQSNLNYYIASKLYWHLDRNVSELMDEFITLYHGEVAAPYVKQFIDLFERHYATLRSGDNYIIRVTGRPRDFTNPANAPKRLLEQTITIVENAMLAVNNSNLTAAEKETYVKRLTEMIVIPQYMVIENYTAYYEDGFNEYVKEFVKNCNLIGTTMMWEVLSLDGYVSEIDAVIN